MSGRPVAAITANVMESFTSWCLSVPNRFTGWDFLDLCGNRAIWKLFQGLPDHLNGFEGLEKTNNSLGKDVAFRLANHIPVQISVCRIGVIVPYVDSNTTASCCRACYCVFDSGFFAQYPYTFEPSVQNGVIKHCFGQHLHFLFDFVEFF